jgi:hypothetical protein
MSRVLTALGAKEYKVGDEVVFFTTPSKHPGSDPELRDVGRRGVAKVVGVTMGFTAFGPKEVVPYYDVLLPDGKVVREVSPHYFEVEWPKPRNNLDTAFNRVMKALKPLGLSRVRSNVRAGERTLEPQFDKPISVKHVVSLLEGAGIAVDNRGYFTVDVQVTKSGKYATYRGKVHKGVQDDDVLLGVSFGFTPEVDHFLSSRYASQRSAPTMSRSLTAQDRASLIRLASSLPAGSPERKAILAGLSRTSAGDLVNCPNCIGTGSVQVPDKERALHDSKPCPDCKGKKQVSADRAKAIQRSIDKSASLARGTRTAAKRGDIITLTKSIPDFFQEKVVPKGQYVVDKTMRGEVSIRPYPLSAHPGYLVDAAVLATALS